MSALVVATPLDPSEIEWTTDDKLSEQDEIDNYDKFNHPRLRRALILQELESRRRGADLLPGGSFDLSFQVPNASQIQSHAKWSELYSTVHSPGLLDFLSNAWNRWTAFRQGLPEMPLTLAIANAPLPRDSAPQRPSNNVMGQIGYYCTETDTPVFSNLMEELCVDGTLVEMAADMASPDTTVYTLVTHPGHHAAADSFGGFCYVNHVAALAKRLLQKHNDGKQQAGEAAGRVAILDVDYHVGNGTASIFYRDPKVWVVSLHCDPNHEYPFHSGYADETGADQGTGTTRHVPLPPGTDWTTYRTALEQGLDFLLQQQHQEQGSNHGDSPPPLIALLVSLGLDTYDQDPVCVQRAGFHLQGDDFKAMGKLIGQKVSSYCQKDGAKGLPVIFLQEGGYRMDKVAEAAADVVITFCQERQSG